MARIVIPLCAISRFNSDDKNYSHYHCMSGVTLIAVLANYLVSCALLAHGGNVVCDTYK